MSVAQHVGRDLKTVLQDLLQLREAVDKVRLWLQVFLVLDNPNI